MEAPHPNIEHPKTKHYTQTNSEHVILMPDQATSTLKQTAPEPTLGRTKTVRNLNFSKPKARFSEVVTTYYQHHKTVPEPNHHQPLSPQDDTDDQEEDDWFDEEELDDEDEEHTFKKYMKRRKKTNKRALIEWSLFILIMTCLITSLLVKTKDSKVILGLELWKWCLMVLVVFCGRLVSSWAVGFSVFLIERNFMLREKVLYFVYGLRKSFQNCAWLGLVLVAWVIMFPGNSHKDNKIMKKVFRGLVAILIGATIWLLKIVLVKVLASSFHVTTFFDRMKESVFHHYVLDTLSGPPLEAEDAAWINSNTTDDRSRDSMRDHHSQSQPPKSAPLKTTRWGSRRIDIEKLKKLSLEKRPTAWSLKRLVNYVRLTGLSTISTTVDNFGKAESEINSEWEARICAKRIFRNVAKPCAKYIEEEDLLRFLKREEVYTIFPLFEGAPETGRITKTSFKNWVVHAYIERKALAHSLNDTKTAVQQLHKLASALVIVIIIVVSLLVMGLATTKVVFVVTSQLLLVGFMFQNTCKTIFESIIFVFVMHPFDVGDRCVVDGVQMIVEEMNILSTVFLKFDMEKIYYPNSVLLQKPISNFRRSPEMSDSIEFSIDVSTSIDDINALKKAIQTYIESKPNHWVPKHSVLVKEIENVNRMTMGLYVQHTMNHQNFGEKSGRRSELLLELKSIFEKLGIKYHLLPQEIILSHER